MRYRNSLNTDIDSAISPLPPRLRKGMKFDMVRNVCNCPPSIKCKVIYCVKSMCYYLRHYFITNTVGMVSHMVYDQVLSLISDVCSKLKIMVVTFFIDLIPTNVQLHLHIIDIIS